MPYKDPSKQRRAVLIGVAKWRKNNPATYKRSTRKSDLRRRYGITPEQYEELLVKQGGVCAICGNANQSKPNGPRPALAVDHNHITGQLRSLLCSNCNTAIGLVAEDIPRLMAMIGYLKSWNRES